MVNNMCMLVKWASLKSVQVWYTEVIRFVVWWDGETSMCSDGELQLSEYVYGAKHNLHSGIHIQLYTCIF